MSPTLETLFSSVQKTAGDTGFSGVVQIALQGAVFTAAWGLAERPAGVPNTVQTRFGIASGTKGFTAAAIACLIADGRLALETRACEILGSTIRTLPDDVSICHLLTHTSGIGDYYDEESMSDALTFAQTLPLAQLQSTSDFIPLLETARPKFPPGGGFSYCNSGFIVLALIVEATSGQSFPEFLEARVFHPAGMKSTGLFRYDALPTGTATGYVKLRDHWVSNAPYLPVRGGGDGGAFSTVIDCDRFWDAWLGGRIVTQSLVDTFVEPPVRDAQARSYGHGFWRGPEQNLIYLEGYDPGISFRSLVNRRTGDRYTVMANTSAGAWPLVRTLDAVFTAP